MLALDQILVSPHTPEDKAIERLIVRHVVQVWVGEQLMVLVPFSNPGQVDHHRDTSTLQDLGIANARPLQEKRRPTRSVGRNDKFPRLDGAGCLLRGLRVEERIATELGSHGLVVFDQDARDLRFDKNV